MHFGSLATLIRRKKSLQIAIQKKELLPGQKYTRSLNFANPDLSFIFHICLYSKCRQERLRVHVLRVKYVLETKIKFTLQC